MISRTAQYALSILSVLADRPGQRTQGRDIARTTGVPANYLAKIMSRLTRGGFVDGRKGWGGGFTLTPRGAKKPLLGVMELFDGLPGRHECLFGLRRCNEADPCPLHDHWEQIRSSFREMLTRTKVGQLASGR